MGRPTEVEGLATFDKKVILFGSEGNAKVFESKYKEDAFDPALEKNKYAACSSRGGRPDNIGRKAC